MQISGGSLRSGLALATEKVRVPPIHALRGLFVKPERPVKCAEMKLLYIARGETEITHPGGVLRAGQGDVAFLPANQPYLSAPPSTVETIAICIDPAFAAAQLQWLPYSGRFLEDLLMLPGPQLLALLPSHRGRLRAQLQELARIDTGNARGELR